LTIKDGNNKFVVCTFQSGGVRGLKTFIEDQIDTPKFDLYKNSVHPKNLMNTNDSLGHYFDIEKDNNKTVIVHPTTPKTPSTK
ncbi:3662_t:CDS:1, partial [Funneliformis geosporum]